MQPFKEIQYQNYIELRFNQKNLHEAAQQQALIRYKRNAQVLAEIFSLERKPLNNFQSQCNISQDQLENYKKQIAEQQLQTQQKLKNIQANTKNFQQLLEKTKQISNTQQLSTFIKQLKQNDLYDECHPFFAEGSPFYLSSTDHQYLQAKQAKAISLQGLAFLQIN